jgi:hypothetical protein
MGAANPSIYGEWTLNLSEEFNIRKKGMGKAFISKWANQMQKKLIAGALAAFGFFASQAVLAEPAPAGFDQAANGSSALTLVAGPHGGAGGHAGIAGGGVHSFAGPSRSFAGRNFAGGHWRHGHFRRGIGPFAGFWYDYDYGYGGSCYWNCRNAGYGPSYCRAYADNFCY